MSDEHAFGYFLSQPTRHGHQCGYTYLGRVYQNPSLKSKTKHASVTSRKKGSHYDDGRWEASHWKGQEKIWIHHQSLTHVTTPQRRTVCNNTTTAILKTLMWNCYYDELNSKSSHSPRRKMTRTLHSSSSSSSQRRPKTTSLTTASFTTPKNS